MSNTCSIIWLNLIYPNYTYLSEFISLNSFNNSNIYVIISTTNFISFFRPSEKSINIKNILLFLQGIRLMIFSY